uniref:Thrombospondin-like N-terminal domain-containing protein n=1 Tax=Meloidogyne enterolobii TaxID=390850 RepID=A0A6V7TK40_MELEN|nr:unnamed protein product [Meloidogyne enterolobii]
MLYIFAFCCLHCAVISIGTIKSFEIPGDEETEANLLIPVENLIDTDPRVFRTAGLDGLPAVGIKRGVEIVVPYRIYLPRKFYRNFAILASIRPSDNLGGFLFAVLNAFDTIVELGPTQTNISLFYTDSSSTDSSEQRSTSRVLASFLVPVFAGQWTQFALEVHEQTVGLYFRCMRYAVRQVYRHPTQLQMDDASKLYIANAGPIIGGGFEGAIQELKLHDDPAEAANQCNENWWKKRRRDFSREGDYQPQDSEKSGLVSSGFGSLEENGLRVDEGEEEEGKGRFPSTPPGSGPARFLPKNINLLTTTLTTTTKQQKEETKTTLPPTLHTPLIQQQIQMIPGPKGERGEPGIPGTCAVTECRMPPPGPPGLQGPPGVFPGLTEHDLRRIAAWPGVKGEKGDRGECCDKTTSKQTYREGYQDGGEEEVVLLNGQHSDQLPAYNRKVHGSSNSIKGEKGDRGERGPPGLPGKLIEKPQSPSFSGVRVFQTALELLAATPNCPIGFLAFALSTQQLFIRVNSGWKQIILGGNLLTAQSGTKERTVDDNVSSPSISNNNADDSDELNRLSYWLALDEPSSEEFRADNEMINTLPSPEQRWQPRFPPKENRRFEEEKEEEKQKNRVPSVQQKRHKDRIIHLIALNEPLNGNFGGVRGADLECYKQARQFGFTTTFRAFLSSRVQDLNKVVHEDDRSYTPIVNIRGERLFDSWNSVFDGERSVHAHVPIYSFNRRDVISDNNWPDRWLWHGSTAEGSRTSTAFCDGWYSNNSNSFGNASPLHSRHSLTGQSKEANCNNRFVVLCVEVMSKFNVDSKLGKRFMSDDVIRK